MNIIEMSIGKVLAEIVKAAVLGIIEGVTEWLPVSSTGHMILADEFIRLEASNGFVEMFLVVVQLGAVLAVAAAYWRRLSPFAARSAQKKLPVNGEAVRLWSKILIACVPAAVIGLLFDDKINELFFNYKTVAAALIFYGILFILIERRKVERIKIDSIERLDYKTALYIGLFQVLALIPGTSRSGATILGAVLLGTSRVAAAEFSFFLAIPVMFGASLLKLYKFGLEFSASEIVVLLTGAAAAFAVSVATVKFLTGYVRRHDFKVFGWYRIALGIAVLLILN